MKRRSHASTHNRPCVENGREESTLKYHINWGKQTLDIGTTENSYKKGEGYVLCTSHFFTIPTEALAAPASLFTVLCKNFDIFAVPLPQFIRYSYLQTAV
jgi:hypothetical protein